ncbi:glycosyltransferase family 2 protein [Lacibacter sediminis]|uniref:Glycosyltransferase family 2 protein n=1 Tax=Lacibacter sediminis TaxID=2760713 RepID=A0A7G5XGP7_9BACT|nr:glycosyltransferase family 2 protein [Lacibacter sediminis]QNA44650.1 glycosyltransferase family 2 protein [Lacibacter sediminis]
MSDSAKFIIIPSFNEEIVLRSTVEPLINQGYHVVVVDDGSTIEQEKFIADLQVTTIRHVQNLGQGAALETGTVYALAKGASYIVHFDADGQHDLSAIEHLLAPILNNTADVVFGSRFLTQQSSLPFTRSLLLHTARYVNFLFTGLLLSDAHNGLRAFNRKAADLIRIKENRMAHASEILILVKKNKLRFTEVAVDVRYTAYSKAKGQSGWNSIRIFFDLLLHKLLR